MLENIHYNIHATDRLIISPSLSLLGADGEIHEGDGGNAGGVVLSSGVGINTRFFLTERVAVGSSLNLKRFFVWGETAFTREDHSGYTLAINLGYAF